MQTQASEDSDIDQLDWEPPYDVKFEVRTLYSLNVWLKKLYFSVTIAGLRVLSASHPQHHHVNGATNPSCSAA
jgi:hypothetical protein